MEVPATKYRDAKHIGLTLISNIFEQTASKITSSNLIVVKLHPSSSVAAADYTHLKHRKYPNAGGEHVLPSLETCPWRILSTGRRVGWSGSQIDIPAGRASQTSLPHWHGVGSPPELCIPRTLWSTPFRLSSNTPAPAHLRLGDWRFYVLNPAIPNLTPRLQVMASL